MKVYINCEFLAAGAASTSFNVSDCDIAPDRATSSGVVTLSGHHTVPDGDTIPHGDALSDSKGHTSYPSDPEDFTTYSKRPWIVEQLKTGQQDNDSLSDPGGWGSYPSLSRRVDRPESVEESWEDDEDDVDGVDDVDDVWITRPFPLTPDNLDLICIMMLFGRFANLQKAKDTLWDIIGIDVDVMWLLDVWECLLKQWRGRVGDGWRVAWWLRQGRGNRAVIEIMDLVNTEPSGFRRFDNPLTRMKLTRM
ncbi:hypothetical protein MMC20_006179 [Loxospora ochrophaea]|nr:hypothetical protein [Loxospora ochrophaea]